MWIQSNVRFGPVSDIKVCNQYGRYSTEVQVQSLFQDQTVSGIGIVNCIDKFVREKPCGSKRKRKLRGNLVQKRDQYWNRHQQVVGTLLSLNREMDWHWYTGIQGSLLFSSVKIHHSITSTKSKRLSRRWWSSPLRPSYWWMQEKTIRQYWILIRLDEEAFRNAQHWLTERWISVLAKGGGQKKRFQYCLNPTYLHQFLYLRVIQGHSGSTNNLALQDNVLLPEGFTEYIYHVRNGKELRSIVNHGLIPGGVSLRTGTQAVFFTIVNPMDNQDGSGETLCDLSQARIAPYKILGNHFRIQYVGAIWSSLNKEDCIFIKQDQTQLFSTTHCLQSSLRKRHAWRPRISFTKGKAWF